MGVVFGGASVEHTISIRSARAVIAAADSQRWRVVPFAVSRSGTWLSPQASEDALRAFERGAPEEIAEPFGSSSARLAPATISALLQCDVVFPLIHGATGEDGAIQGFFETLGVAYVGSGVAASAIAMDKTRCKRILEDAGIPVAPSITVTCAEWREDHLAVERRMAELGYPQFVKPSRGGSSIGASKIYDREGAAEALTVAFACDREALIEVAMPEPREIECGVLGGLRDAPPIASPPGEIRTTREFYDYTAKYEDPATELIAPADLDSSLNRRLQQLSLDAWRAIGAAGMVRADFLVGEQGRSGSAN